MSVITIPVGELQANCYLLVDDSLGTGLVIDPGDEAGKILAGINRIGITVSGIINTHGHADHIGANSEIKARCGNPPVYIHPADAPMLTSPVLNLSRGVGGADIVSPAADILINDGDIVRLSGKIALKVLHTPGHTAGGVCLYLEEECLFSGDTLFHEDVGRCDLPGGDELKLLRSLKRLLRLPAELAVLPGHEESTTIGNERHKNPMVRFIDKAE